MNNTAICPNCETKHEIGEYILREENEKRISAPPDIQCNCGLILRPFVPIFKVTESGYILRQKLPNEVIRT